MTPLPVVVVVDPEPQTHELVASALASDGFQTLGWRHSQGAHALIGCEQPVLVLINDRLERPRVGWRLLEELHWDPATTAIPVIIVSDDRETVNASLRKLAYAVLAEPFALQDLLRLARRASESTALRRAVMEMTPAPGDAPRSADT